MILTRRALAIALACAASASAFSGPSAGVLGRRPLRKGARAHQRGSLGLRAQQSTAGLPDISTLGKVAQELGRSLQYAAQEPLRAQYGTAMIARFSYFLAQGIGVALAGINQGTVADGRVDSDSPAAQASTRTLDPVAVIGALTDAILADSDAQVDAAAAKLENISMQDKPFLENDEQRALFNKNFQSIVKLIKTDLKNIEEGKYKLPYDMEFGYAPQWTPAPVLRKLNIYVQERTKIIDRMYKQDALEVRKNFKPGDGKYPEYYLQNFHYQSDGWLSARSAEIYDYQVESLFLGMADAMRRQVMPSIAAHMNALKSKGAMERDIKVLDVATGTGRFASFVKQNFPGLPMDVLDLSPFYLAEAKKLLSKYDDVTYVEAAAEKVPSEDATYDVITCVYLFHELPEAVRTEVVKEWYRVLKPGGKIFFVDSAQAGEVPYDRVLEGFTIIAHEPYYLNYTQQDLTKMFTDVGFSVDTSEVHWVSKFMVVTKPAVETVAEPAPAEEAQAAQ